MRWSRNPKMDMLLKDVILSAVHSAKDLTRPSVRSCGMKGPARPAHNGRPYQRHDVLKQS